MHGWIRHLPTLHSPVRFSELCPTTHLQGSAHTLPPSFHPSFRLSFQRNLLSFLHNKPENFGWGGGRQAIFTLNWGFACIAAKDRVPFHKARRFHSQQQHNHHGAKCLTHVDANRPQVSQRGGVCAEETISFNNSFSQISMADWNTGHSPCLVR